MPLCAVIALSLRHTTATRHDFSWEASAAGTSPGDAKATCSALLEAVRRSADGHPQEQHSHRVRNPLGHGRTRHASDKEAESEEQHGILHRIRLIRRRWDGVVGLRALQLHGGREETRDRHAGIFS